MLYYRDSKGKLSKAPIKATTTQEQILREVRQNQAGLKAELRATSPVLYVIC